MFSLPVQSIYPSIAVQVDCAIVFDGCACGVCRGSRWQAFRERLERGEVSFADLAAQESHCSSAKRGGDLGEFGPGQMQKAFEDATYALQVWCTERKLCVCVRACV